PRRPAARTLFIGAPRSAGAPAPRRPAARTAEGLAEPGQSVFHVGSEALAQHLEVAQRLRVLYHAERVPPAWHRQIVGVVAGDLDEHAGVRAALVQLTRRVQIARPEADAGRDPEP